MTAIAHFLTLGNWRSRTIRPSGEIQTNESVKTGRNLGLVAGSEGSKRLILTTRTPASAFALGLVLNQPFAVPHSTFYLPIQEIDRNLASGIPGMEMLPSDS